MTTATPCQVHSEVFQPLRMREASKPEEASLPELEVIKSHGSMHLGNDSLRTPGSARQSGEVAMSHKEIEEKLVTTVEPPDGGWGWMIVFSSFVIHIIIDGITYSMGVLFIALVEDFESSKGDTAMIISIFVGVTLMSGPISSGLVNLYGCRTVTVAGAIIGAFGFVLSMFATGIWYLYISIGIIAGFGFGLIYLPAIVVVSYYFEKKRALATGLACCGSGVGTFIFAPLIHMLVNEYGWRQSCLWLAGILLQCTIFGALFRPLPVIDNTEDVNGNAENTKTKENLSKSESHIVKSGVLSSPRRVKNQGGLTSLSSLRDHDPVQGHQLKVHVPLHRRDVFYSASLQNIPLYQNNKAEYVHSNMSIAHSLYQAQHSKEPESKGKDDPRVLCFNAEFSAALRETVDLSLLKDWGFVLFLVSNVFTNFGFNAPFLFLTDRANEMGIAKDQSKFLLSIVGIANIAGRVFFGWLADLKYVLPRRLYVYASGLIIAGLATAFSMATSYAAQAIYSIVWGSFIGCYISLTAVILVDLLGVDKLTSSFGMTLLVQGVAVLVGPPVCGWIYDALNTYTYSFLVIGLAIAVGGFVLYFIPCVVRIQKRRATAEQRDLGKRIGVDARGKDEEAQQLE